jgi:hypothetical protein
MQTMADLARHLKENTDELENILFKILGSIDTLRSAEKGILKLLTNKEIVGTDPPAIKQTPPIIDEEKLT